MEKRRWIPEGRVWGLKINDLRSRKRKKKNQVSSDTGSRIGILAFDIKKKKKLTTADGKAEWH